MNENTAPESEAFMDEKDLKIMMSLMEHLQPATMLVGLTLAQACCRKHQIIGLANFTANLAAAMDIDLKVLGDMLMHGQMVAAFDENGQQMDPAEIAAKAYEAGADVEVPSKSTLN